MQLLLLSTNYVYSAMLNYWDMICGSHSQETQNLIEETIYSYECVHIQREKEREIESAVQMLSNISSQKLVQCVTK